MVVVLMNWSPFVALVQIWFQTHGTICHIMEYSHRFRGRRLIQQTFLLYWYDKIQFLCIFSSMVLALAELQPQRTTFYTRFVLYLSVKLTYQPFRFPSHFICKRSLFCLQALCHNADRSILNQLSSSSAWGEQKHLVFISWCLKLKYLSIQQHSCLHLRSPFQSGFQRLSSACRSFN